MIKKWNVIICTFLTFIGAIGILNLINSPSEEGSAFLFGFSIFRLLVFLVALLIFSLILLISIFFAIQPNFWKKLESPLHKLISNNDKSFILLSLGFIIFAGLFSFLILSLSDASKEAVIFSSILDRAGSLIIWIELILLAVGFLYWINYPKEFKASFSPLKLSILFFLTTLFYFVTLKLFAFYTWDIRFGGTENFIFLPAVLSILWAWLYQKYSFKDWYKRLENIILSLVILMVVFVIFRHTSQWMDWRHTPSKAYWNLLADAFLQGRLYLINPTSTHDLTFYQGKWYVPNPPLPAFILMPFVALLGLENINMVVFSIWCGALTVLLVFWLLETGSLKGLIPTNRNGNLWITAVFAVGTCFWWLSIMGRMWFISQIFTVTFTTLAAILVIHKKSPFLVGAALGLAILARPNVFTVWPFLLGIYMYLENTLFPKIPWRKVIHWSIKSAIPIGLSVAGLLFYNYIRFDDFMDFGYVNISSADWIMDAVQTYGMFHPHFFQSNFSMMFLNHPLLRIENGCFAFSASMDGYSLFVMTPVVIYIFRRFRTNWWVVGSWVAVGLTVGLLLFYHNNGAAQLGYRYFMDFVIPVLYLMALGVGEKPSWFFKLLTIITIIGNLFGIMWWFQKWWC